MTSLQLSPLNIPDVETQFFVFYNPLSGNRQGAHLKAYAFQYARFKQQLSTQIQMFDITVVEEFTNGIQYLKESYIDEKIEKLVICSAAGDGTFASLLQLIVDSGMNISSSKMFFTVFGFGTGNDLSQSLGFGRRIPLKDSVNMSFFQKHVIDRLNGMCKPFDVWKMIIKVDGIGYVRKSGKKDLIQDEFSRFMSNYVTLGLQGIVGINFEATRQKTRVGNIFQYVKYSFLHGVVGRIESVSSYVDHLEHNGILYSFNEKKSQMVELIFQNILGIWGQRMKLWDICKPSASICKPNINGCDYNRFTQSSFGDKRLDVYGIKSKKDYLFKQMPMYSNGSSLRRVGQFGDSLTVHFKPNKTVYFCCDGEFLEAKNITSMTLQHMNSIKVLTGE